MQRNGQSRYSGLELDLLAYGMAIVQQLSCRGMPQGPGHLEDFFIAKARRYQPLRSHAKGLCLLHIAVNPPPQGGGHEERIFFPHLVNSGAMDGQQCDVDLFGQIFQGWNGSASDEKKGV